MTESPAGSSVPDGERARASRGEAWLAAALLFALMSAVHFDVVFLGRSAVVSNAWNPMDYRPLAQNYGDALIPQEEWNKRNLWPFPNLRDPMATIWQWEPAIVFLQDAIRQGEWPFWNPYNGAGTPAMANLVPAFFFPPFLIMVALGASVHVMNAYFLLLLWGASFLTFLFLRRHELGFSASLAGAAIVLTGGAMNQHLGSFMMQATAGLPLALYVTRLLLDAPSNRRVALVAVAYASIALASFPPILVGVFGVTVIYALTVIAVGDCGRSRRQTGLRWVGAAAIALGLVGFYYGPAIALRGDAPQVAARYKGGGLTSLPAITAFQLLSPSIMGGTQVYVQGPFAAKSVDDPVVPYVGTVCIMTLLLASPRGSRRRRTVFVFSAVAAAAILAKLYGIPPVQWMGYLPFFDQIHYDAYFGIPLGFPLAFLAALGMDAVNRGTVSFSRAVLAAAPTLLSVAIILWLAARTGGLAAAMSGYWVRDWALVALAAVLASMTLLMATLVGWSAKMRLAVITVFLGVIAAEGIYNNSYPNQRAWAVFAQPVPYIQKLKQAAAEHRILSFGAPVADVNEAFAISSLDSLMAFNPPRVYELFRHYGGSPPAVFMREATRIPPEPVLDRSNIAIVSIRNEFGNIIEAARARGFTPVFDDGYVTLFERPTLPRFFYSTSYRVVPTAAALEAIGTVPSREIILEEPPGVASTPDGADGSSVRVDSHRRNSISLMVDAETPGLVYAAESFLNGWTARVNGAPARILPANYAFRAVVVPAGRSQVEFHYWPPGLTPGLAVSGVSAVVLLALLFVRKRPAGGSPLI